METGRGVKFELEVVCVYLTSSVRRRGSPRRHEEASSRLPESYRLAEIKMGQQRMEKARLVKPLSMTRAALRLVDHFLPFQGAELFKHRL